MPKKQKMQTDFQHLNEAQPEPEETRVKAQSIAQEFNRPEGAIGHGELAKTLLNYTDLLYSKSKIGKREMLTLTQAIWEASTYQLPTLLTWVNDWVTLKMSEEGWAVDNVMKAYQRMLEEQGMMAKAEGKIKALEGKL